MSSSAAWQQPPGDTPEGGDPEGKACAELRDFLARASTALAAAQGRITDENARTLSVLLCYVGEQLRDRNAIKQDQLAAAAADRAHFAAGWAARDAQLEAERAQRGHRRVPSRRGGAAQPPLMRVVKGSGAGGVLLLAGRALPVRHAVKIKAAAAVAMITVPAASAAAVKIACAPDSDPLPPRHHAVMERAQPPAFPSPLLSYTMPAPQGKHHRKPGRHAATPVIVVTPPPSSSPPSPPPSPDPSPSPPQADPGTLLVPQQPGGLHIGASGIEQLSVTALGGPVIWSASATPGITLSEDHGSLQPGGTADIQVSVDPPLMMFPGSGTVTLSYGKNQAVTVNVTWG